MSGHFSDFHAVSNYREAVALLASERFDAVITEQHLDGGTGIDLYALLRLIDLETPFILMCGGDRHDFDDPNFLFFAKPFTLSNLAEALSQMIDNLEKSCRS